MKETDSQRLIHWILPSLCFCAEIERSFEVADSEETGERWSMPRITFLLRKWQPKRAFNRCRGWRRGREIHEVYSDTVKQTEWAWQQLLNLLFDYLRNHWNTQELEKRTGFQHVRKKTINCFFSCESLICWKPKKAHLLHYYCRSPYHSGKDAFHT